MGKERVAVSFLKKKKKVKIWLFLSENDAKDGLPLGYGVYPMVA